MTRKVGPVIDREALHVVHLSRAPGLCIALEDAPSDVPALVAAIRERDATIAKLLGLAADSRSHIEPEYLAEMRAQAEPS